MSGEPDDMTSEPGREDETACEVHRKFPLPGIAHPFDGTTVERTLSQIDGIREIQVDIKRRQVRVRYSLQDVDYRQIATALEQVGFPLADDRWTGLKARWFQYLDETGRDNLSARTSPCCNRPPVVKR